MFSDNRAKYGVASIDTAGIAMHDANIKATAFTDPYDCGYNNLDIYYPQVQKVSLQAQKEPNQFSFGLFRMTTGQTDENERAT